MAVWQMGGWCAGQRGLGRFELGSLHCMAAPLHPPATHRFEGEEHEEREGAGPGGNDHEAQQLHAQPAPAAAVEHAPVVGVAVSFDGGGLQAGTGRWRRRWVCGLRRGPRRQGRAGQCRGHRRAVQMGRVDSHSSAVGQAQAGRYSLQAARRTSVAKKPVAMIPHMPQKKCTGAASTGSSMRSLLQGRKKTTHRQENKKGG